MTRRHSFVQKPMDCVVKHVLLLPTLSIPQCRTTVCNLIRNVSAGVTFELFYQMNNTKQSRDKKIKLERHQHIHPIINKTLNMHSSHPHLRKI